MFFQHNYLDFLSKLEDIWVAFIKNFYFYSSLFFSKNNCIFSNIGKQLLTLKINENS
jgi:hypothetical protein